MKKIKVMVVDDEILVLEDIKDQIDWEKNGYSLVAATTSCKEAIKLYKEHQPHILIVDIIMPGMSGFDLCRELFSTNPPSKVIILTSFKDFEYARSAIDLGVSSYLLKHELNGRVLLSTLDNIRDEIISEEKQESLMAEQVLRKFITEGYILEDDEKNYLKQFYENLCMLILCIDTPYKVLDYSLPENTFKDELNLELGCILNDNCIDKFNIIKINNMQYVLLMGLSRMDSFKCTWEKAYFISSVIQKWFKNQYRRTITVIICPVLNDFKSLPKLYQKVNHSLHKSIFWESKIMSCETIKDMGQAECAPREAFEEGLNNIEKYARLMDYKGLEKALSHIFQMTTKPYADISGFHFVVMRLVQMLNMLRHENMLSSLEEEFQNGKMDANMWYSVADIEQWFLKEFEKLIMISDEIIEKQYSKQIQRALVYIHNNYNKELTVENIAKSLNFCSSYFLRIFKKATGKTFVEYLTDYRIEKAKELLQNENYRISEIAQMTGYNTSQYFSRVFYKQTRMYPSEYRNRGNQV